jgi:hypothetical protein
MQVPVSSKLVLNCTRAAFGCYFIFSFWAAFDGERLQLHKPALIWVLYLLGIYLVAEALYDFFLQNRIDLSFSFPLLFAAYCLNLTTILLGGQDKYPLFNRTEHFVSYILIAFVVWTFFTKYLPQNVWQEHPYYTAILALSVTSLIGVVNELFELFFDHFFNTQLVGARYDTSLDLLMNTLGSGLFLSVYLILNHAVSPQTSSAKKHG